MPLLTSVAEAPAQKAIAHRHSSATLATLRASSRALVPPEHTGYLTTFFARSQALHPDSNARSGAAPHCRAARGAPADVAPGSLRQSSCDSSMPSRWSSTRRARYASTSAWLTCARARRLLTLTLSLTLDLT